MKNEEILLFTNNMCFKKIVNYEWSYDIEHWNASSIQHLK